MSWDIIFNLLKICYILFKLHMDMWQYFLPIQGSVTVFFTYTVKPVFKGHCDEGTPCDQGTLSQKRCPIFPMLRNMWRRDTCHVGTISLRYKGVPWRQVLLYKDLWQYFNLREDLWQYFNLYKDLWQYFNLYKDLWQYFNLYKDLWQYFVTYIRICDSILTYIRICDSIF